MYEKEVIVTTRYSQCPSFVACPDGPGPYPGPASICVETMPGKPL